MHHKYFWILLGGMITTPLLGVKNAHALGKRVKIQLITEESQQAWRQKHAEDMEDLRKRSEELQRDPSVQAFIAGAPYLHALQKAAQEMTITQDYPDSTRMVTIDGKEVNKNKVAEEAHVEQGYTAPRYAFMLKHLAEQGHPLSQTEYANCLIWGTHEPGPEELEREGMCGVRADIPLGIAYLLTAASSGEESAGEILGYYAKEKTVTKKVAQLRAIEKAHRPKPEDLQHHEAYNAFIAETARAVIRKREELQEKERLEAAENSFGTGASTSASTSQSLPDSDFPSAGDSLSRSNSVDSLASVGSLDSLIVKDELPSITMPELNSLGEKLLGSREYPGGARTIIVDPSVPSSLAEHFMKIRRGQDVLPQTVFHALEEDALWNPHARFLLGRVYYQGLLGLPLLLEKGLEMLQSAADEGELEAVRMVGVIYMGNSGLSANDALATRYLWKAVTAGDPKAYWLLGVLYHMGKEVHREIPNPDERRALETPAGRKAKVRDYFKRAWEAGVKEAAPALVATYQPQEAANLLRYLEEAERREQVEASGLLAQFWDKNRPGFPKNRQKALSYYHRSAEKGEDIGLIQMAHHYFFEAQKVGFEASLRGKEYVEKAKEYIERTSHPKQAGILLSDKFSSESAAVFGKNIALSRKLAALALRLNPSNQIAWNNVGTMYLRQKVEIHTQMLDLLGPLMPLPFKRAIYCYLRAGDLPQAQSGLRDLKSNAYLLRSTGSVTQDVQEEWNWIVSELQERVEHDRQLEAIWEKNEWKESPSSQHQPEEISGLFQIVEELEA